MSTTNNSQRSRSRERDRNKSENDSNKNISRAEDRELSKKEDFENLKERNNHSKSNHNQSLDNDDNGNEENVQIVADLSQSFNNEITSFASLNTATPYSMNTLTPSDCNGTLKCRVHINLKGIKQTFRKMKKAGLYEELPSDVMIDGIRIGVRIWPNGVNFGGWISSCISFECKNRAEIYQRIKGIGANKYEIICNVSHGGRSMPLEIKLSDFIDSDAVYKDVAIAQNDWAKHSNIIFQFSVSKNQWTK
eukprot:432985_1